MWSGRLTKTSHRRRRLERWWRLRGRGGRQAWAGSPHNPGWGSGQFLGSPLRVRRRTRLRQAHLGVPERAIPLGAQFLGAQFLYQLLRLGRRGGLRVCLG